MTKSKEEKTAKNKGKESNTCTQETPDTRNSNERKESSKKNQTKSKDKDNDKHAKDNTKKSSARKDYCEEELERIGKRLQQTAEEIKEKKPEIKEFCPDTFNALEPYCDVHDPQFLLSQTDDFRCGYTARYTAIEIPKPWLSHRLDVEVPPRDISNLSKKQNGEKIGTTEEAGTTRKPEKTGCDVGGGGGTRETGATKGTGEAREHGGTKKTGGTERDRSSQDASSSVDSMSHTGPTEHRRRTVATTSVHKKGQLLFTDVPKIRREMSEVAGERKNNDCYRRTKADFYRLKLDEMDEYAPQTRPRMKKAYLAYLQNTPGSKKAVIECIGKIEKRESSRSASARSKPPKADTVGSHRSEEK